MMCMTRHVVSGLGWAWVGVPGCHTGRDDYIFFLGTVLETFAVSLCLAGLASSSSTTWITFACVAFCCFSFVPYLGRSLSRYWNHRLYIHTAFSREPNWGSRLFGASWSEWYQNVQDARGVDGWIQRIDNARQCRPVEGNSERSDNRSTYLYGNSWVVICTRAIVKRLCLHTRTGSWADYDNTRFDIPASFTESRLKRERERERERDKGRLGLALPHRRRARRACGLCSLCYTA